MKLAGVTVVDFSQHMAGPMVSGLMADHGARVIKVEPPNGDPTRHGVRSMPGQAAGDSFCVLNRGKLSIVLDLKDPSDRAAALKLFQDADVVLESFRPGVADKLGLGYDAARAQNANLVYCSLSAFGSAGLLRDVPAHDTVVQALAGTLARDENGRPVNPSVSLAGIVSAQLALSGILMALLTARDGRGGDHIDISMHDAALAIRGGATFAALAAVDPAHRNPPANIGLAMTEVYRTSDDRWICLGIREERPAKKLLDALGLGQFYEFAIGPPGETQIPLRRALGVAFAGDTMENWVVRLGDLAGFFAAVLDHAEALAHPHTASRDMILTDPFGVRHLNTPIRFAAMPSKPDLRIASLGADNQAVLTRD